MNVIADKFKLGGIQRQVRRTFIAADGNSLLLEYCVFA
jgi:hypothetical protein